MNNFNIPLPAPLARIVEDSRDASKDSHIPYEDACRLFDLGRLAIDEMNSHPCLGGLLDRHPLPHIVRFFISRGYPLAFCRPYAFVLRS